MEPLTDDQQALLRSLVRKEIRHLDRGVRSAIAKWQDDYDDERHQSRYRFLEETYRALGGDVDNITNRPALPNTPQENHHGH